MKRKLTAAERKAKRLRREKFMTIYINGKMKRVLRRPLIPGAPVNWGLDEGAEIVFGPEHELYEMLFLL